MFTLHCCNKILHHIFVTELVFTFFVFKYQNHFEFPKDGKRSPRLKILEIPGGEGGHQIPPGMENPGGWGVHIKESSVGGGGYGYFLEPHITSFRIKTGWRQCQRNGVYKSIAVFFFIPAYLFQLSL